MQFIDFRNSYVSYRSWCNGQEHNNPRIQILSRCELSNLESGESFFYVLCKDCIGEYVYQDDEIIQVPTSHVSMVFSLSNGESAILKRFASRDRDSVQIQSFGDPVNTFNGSQVQRSDLRIDLAEARARRLDSEDEIIESTQRLEPLQGRTTLEGAGWRVSMEYPITYINLHLAKKRFQVDVGPILFYDMSFERPFISGMQFAYVLYNRFDRAEFAILAPTSTEDESRPNTSHYSKVTSLKAQNELFSLSGSKEEA